MKNTIKKLTLLTIFAIFAIMLSADSGSVYVCSGKYATKYHRIADCRGLGNCKGEILKVSIKTAQADGRTACKICFR
jgi:hypothetical protein